MESKFRRMSTSNYLDVETKPMIAVIGVTAKERLLVATPDGLKAPREIQAAVLATLLNGSNISAQTGQMELKL